MFQNILIGYDGSQSAQIALQRAVLLAKEINAKLTMVCVCEPLPHHSYMTGGFEEDEVSNAEFMDEYFKARCEEVKGMADKNNISVTCERAWGNPAEGIIKFADKEYCDLIIVGHSNHSGLWGKLLGDTADRIADHAHCSVLIVKNHEAEE